MAMIRAVRERAADGILVLLLHAVLAAWAFRPVVLAPTRVNTPNSDTYGNIWALTWVAEHLAHPHALFAANIYWPNPNGLAFTEGLFPQAVQAAPLLACGVSPVLAYNVVWFLTFPLSGLGMYLLARRVSGSKLGALVASLSYAFGAYRIGALPHLQTLSIQWLPFALLALLDSLENPRLSHLLRVTLFTAAQALSSGYYAALLVPTITVVLMFHLRAPGLRRSMVALALATVLVALVFWPYLVVQHEIGVHRSREECAHWSARWGALLNPGRFSASPLKPILRHTVDNEDEALYPGGIALALGLVSLASFRKDRRIRLFGTLGIVGVLLALGPNIQLGPLRVTGPYELLRTLPGFTSLRTPARMLPLGMVALGCLAAITWQRLGLEWSDRRKRWVALALLGFALWESLPHVGAAVRELAPIPAYARWLASAPRGPVLELPWDQEGIYLYWSTAHWQPLVNGWGAYGPPGSGWSEGVGRRFPLPGAVALLRAAGVRYVVEHLGALPAKLQDRVLHTPLPVGVRLLSDAEGHRLYEIDPAGLPAPAP